MTRADRLYEEWLYINRYFEDVNPERMRKALNNLEEIIAEWYTVDYVECQEEVLYITGLNISGTSEAYVIHDLQNWAMRKASEKYLDFLGE